MYITFIFLRMFTRITASVWWQAAKLLATVIIEQILLSSNLNPNECL